MAKNTDRKRMCYYVPADAFIEGCGWRPSVVVENEPGHCPTGTWPYHGRVGETLPYFWGDDPSPEGYDKACAAADSVNERMGISKKDAFEIVTSSMAASDRAYRTAKAKARRQLKKEGRR